MNEDEREFILPANKILVGRSYQCDWILKENHVSRKHCEIEYNKTRGKEYYTITDLGSKYGTYINSIRIKKGFQEELNDMTRLKIGDREFIVHIEE
jgi:pSer/pThr/pTyr-binding forkhead associated (FHA) protein